jgi:3-hydroxyisobutyrate dehydrogenase
MKKHVAVLGLGNMGAGMARRLLHSGFSVIVYNRRREVAAPFADAGANVASTPAEAAKGAELIVSMVADDEASRAVWLGANGALSNIDPGTIVVESSTLTPGWVEQLAAAASEKGCPMLDAPVTGSKMHANAGELLFLVGGSADVLEKARPALRAMSRDIIHLGPIGSGARMKLVNNFVCAVQISALAEAIALISRVGLDPAQALSVLTNGAPGSPLVKTIAGRISDKQFDTQFAARLMEKDLNYAARMAQSVGFSLRTLEPAAQLFHDAVVRGLGDKDMAIIIEPLLEKRQSGAA